MAKDADPLGNDSFSVHHNIATDLAQFFVGYFAIVIGQFNTITRNPKFGGMWWLYPFRNMDMYGL